MGSDDYDDSEKEITEDFDEPKKKSCCTPLVCIIVTVLLFFIVMHVLTALHTEGWLWSESIYFTVQVFTTIGYGDITPVTATQRLITAGFVLFCLVGVSYLLNTYVSHTLDNEEAFLMNTFNKAHEESNFEDAHEENLREKKNKVYTHFAVSTVIFGAFILFGTIFYANLEHCTCSYGVTHIAGCNETSYEDCKNTGGQCKDYISAFYFSVITLTTVGFGDFTTASWWGRIVGIFWMILGVGSAGNWVVAAQSLFFSTDSDRHTTPKHHMGDALFDTFDTNGDGKLTEAEYLAYELAQHKFVPISVLQKLSKQYEALPKSDDGLVDYAVVHGGANQADGL